MHKLAEFVHYKSIIISRIAWLYISKKHRIFSLGSKDASCSNLLNISNRRCKRNHAWKCSPKQDQVESPLRRHQSGSSSPILKKNGWWRTSTSLLFGSGMWRAFALFENKNDALIFFYITWMEDTTTLNSQLSFEQNVLDIRLKRNLDSFFSTSIYRKKTFTGLYTKCSFTLRKYKTNLVRTLAYRCIRICSWPRLLQFALDDLKRILLLNSYAMEAVKYHMNDVIEKHQNKPKDPVQTVKKKEVLSVLPFLGHHSKHLRKQLRSCIN